MLCVSLFQLNCYSLELEALNVLFSSEKFHEFEYGDHFEVENDHKVNLRQVTYQSTITYPVVHVGTEFILNYIPDKDAVVPDILSPEYLNDCQTKDMEAK